MRRWISIHAIGWSVVLIWSVQCNGGTVDDGLSFDVWEVSRDACPAGQVYSQQLKRCRQLVTDNPLPAYQIPLADPYEPASAARAQDNYAYWGPFASDENHQRTLADQTISRGDLSVTASVALAGAIASIRYKGFELVASGGHGSAAQLVTHDWTRGTRDFAVAGEIVTRADRPCECNNPTEAGNLLNDQGQNFPYHGPSSSYLEIWGRDWVEGLPRIYSKVSPVDYVPPQSWSEDSGYGQCYNTSDDWFRGQHFHKHVTIGFKKGSISIDNVIQINSIIELGHAVELFDAIFTVYLSRYFTEEYRLSVGRDVLISKARGMSLKDQGFSEINTCFSNTVQLPFVPVFACKDGGMAVALLVRPGPYATESYSQTQFDYCTPNYSHKFRNIAGRMKASDLLAGTKLPFRTMLFVGSLDSVREDIQRYCSTEDCSGPGTGLGLGIDPRVFNWRQYLALNPDLPFDDEGQATSHWLLYGLREGRRGSSDFWSPSYLAKNPDVEPYARTRGYLDHCKAIYHFLMWGVDSGREY